MSKKRKVSTSTPTIKIEVKEENIYGDDVLVARGRLKGALQELIEQSEDDTASSDEDSRKHNYRSPGKKQFNESSNYFLKRRRSDSSPSSAAYHHTYVMKLFDRSVDLARFEEDTPLYPICRAWMANQPRNPQIIIKRRNSTPDRDYDRYSTSLWNGDRMREIFHLPPPISEPICRVPDELKEEDVQTRIDKINLNYEEQPPVPREELIRNHLKKWATVKRRWIAQANKNEERFQPSFDILQTIYNKAQEGME